jgi:glyoxylase-like metal-dependent hydrolase (beta-lactamase superfamily II)
MYQVTILRYGSRSTVKSDVYLNHPVYGEADAPIDMDYFVWIVRDADRTILVDTGFSRHGGEARGRTFLLDLPDAYRALGVDPAAAPTVVLTHAHYDHTGNLGLFPESEIVMAEDELAFWTSPISRRTQFHHSAEDADLAVLAAARDEGRVTTFRGVEHLAPGIEVIQLGGHTPGQSVVTVETSDGVVLLASDAIHFYEEYERDMPFTYVADVPAMYRGFDTIRDWVDTGRVRHVVSGHDAGTLARFAPGTGELAAHTATIGGLA